ncbi:F-box protein-like protein [Salvia divinorum]|uniref:F-box protein-like protein n=1 Tax=Salvia divinorum TaxID=28513 RepID=A0ABD1G5D9_SALDI
MTWPCNSDGNHHFASLSFSRKPKESPTLAKSSKSHLSIFSSPPKSPQNPPDFSELPYDVLARIAAPFALPSLKTASLVCRAWRDALKPLREAMVFLKWGKRYKNGRGGVKANSKKALDCFLKGAARGSTLAMVDAGSIYWGMGKKEEGIAWYRLAAELGDHTGQCNLAICYFQAYPSKTREAIGWLYQASFAGHVRAQYQLALCLHQGRGLEQSLPEAARWYLRAAEGGYVHAMYNTSLCYLMGEAGEIAAAQVKNVILQQLSAT